jgi:LPS export ABC transporter protein LptC
MISGSKNTSLINTLFQKHILKFTVRLFIPCAFLLALLPGCENDLKKVQEISAKDISKNVDSSKVVQVIYSDSARVKVKMQVPLLLQYKTAKPYSEMPKGVKIIVYDAKLNPTTTIVSDYAITRDNDMVIELRKNVVVSSNTGDTFKSNELIWDRTKKVYYSNQPVIINKADGTVLNGETFKSNETFTDYTMSKNHGDIRTKEGLGQ